LSSAPLSEETKSEKKALRAAMKEVRAAAVARHGATAAERIAAQGIGFSGSTPPAWVSGFLPIGEELDPAPLMLRLSAEGYGLCLPVMEAKGKPLLFRAWKPGDVLEEVMWGIREPQPTAPLVEPDVLLSPLLAFDARGYRLGYGGGFYDRTLARLRGIKTVVAIGLALDEQKVDAVPHADYDERVDWVLTPSGPLRCGT
jgi:5-formyltetrahydrofolate cyclo-ligase